jgi:hypothetical protein
LSEGTARNRDKSAEIMPRRIPQALAEFDSYLTNTVNHLPDGTPPNSERLGLNEEQVIYWRSYAKHWKRLYHMSHDKARSTWVTRQDRDKVWKAFVNFAQPVVNLIAANPALTVSDRSTFRIDPPPARGKRRGHIRGRPSIKMRNGDGATLKISYRSNMTGRPRMHPLADLIEMRYLLQSPTDIKDGALQWPPLPKSPDECPVVVMSSRAIFTVTVGMRNMGKQLSAYFRYINTADPSQNGPWTTLMVTIVS